MIERILRIVTSTEKRFEGFGEEYPDSRRIIVSLDRINRKLGDVECMYIKDFLKTLWAEGL